MSLYLFNFVYFSLWCYIGHMIIDLGNILLKFGNTQFCKESYHLHYIFHVEVQTFHSMLGCNCCEQYGLLTRCLHPKNNMFYALLLTKS